MTTLETIPLPAGGEVPALRWRKAAFIPAMSFALASLVFSFVFRSPECWLLCALTPLLLCIPALAERLLGKQLNTAVYILCLFYALGPMLGQTYRLYYITNWWDKLLHLMGGLAFALVGSQMPALLGVKEPKPALRFFCAFFFSVAIAALWEFFEYGMDQLFAMDMQQDRLIAAIHSYELGADLGALGHIGSIQSVLINGQTLPGYLDIGLHDTMGDMLLESLGALLLSLGLFLDKDRHPLFLPKTETEIL